MTETRRAFIKKTLSVSAYSIASTLGWLMPLKAMGQWQAENFTPGKLDDSITRLYKGQKNRRQQRHRAQDTDDRRKRRGRAADGQQPARRCPRDLDLRRKKSGAVGRAFRAFARTRCFRFGAHQNGRNLRRDRGRGNRQRLVQRQAVGQSHDRRLRRLRCRASRFAASAKTARPRSEP